jgi:hypothetical protein
MDHTASFASFASCAASASSAPSAPSTSSAVPRLPDNHLVLAPGAMLTLHGRGELGVVAEADGLWVTQDGFPQDWMPAAGETLRLAGAACVRISAFAPSRLRLDTQRWRWRRGVLVHADGRRERLGAPARRPGAWPGSPGGRA